MENLTLEGSAKTPTIKFDAENGVLELKGRSIPENSIEFYKPLNDWIDSIREVNYLGIQVVHWIKFFRAMSETKSTTEIDQELIKITQQIELYLGSNNENPFYTAIMNMLNEIQDLKDLWSHN